MKTTEVTIENLSSHALDWAVAICEGYTPDTYMRSAHIKTDVNNKPVGIQVPEDHSYIWFSPSTNWEQGGLIIERQCIDLVHSKEDETWWAQSIKGDAIAKKPLVAAMRCYVQSKQGETMHIPNVLLGASK